ncbi:ribonuclease H-like domain-containing protein [Tanacetum coccineum]
MAEYSQKWHNGTSRKRSTKTFDGLALIQAQLNNLGREIKKVNKKDYATQVGCKQCKGPHYTKDCPLQEEAAALGFYQRNTTNPSYQERRQSMEESLSKFMNESAKRHEENSDLIKEIQASTDAAIRNQRASIKTLKIQIRQMSNGIVENVLVGIGKFVFPVYFIILDMHKDVKVPLILGRPFLSTAQAKIDVFKRKITLRVGDEKIIFKSMKPASSLIKRVYMLGLRERMELDLKARPMRETLVLNKLSDPFYEDYIELNDLNVPLELRRDQVDDLMPTIEDGKEFYNSIMKDKVEYKGKNVVGAFMNVPIFIENFSVVTHFLVMENMDGYRDQDMGDIIVGEPF